MESKEGVGWMYLCVDGKHWMWMCLSLILRLYYYFCFRNIYTNPVIAIINVVTFFSRIVKFNFYLK